MGYLGSSKGVAKPEGRDVRGLTPTSHQASLLPARGNDYDATDLYAMYVMMP